MDGCQYCKNEEENVLYQTNRYADLYMGSFGRNRILMVETNKTCPPYADCTRKGEKIRVAFIINFCPHCGRKLNEWTEKGGSHDA